MKGDFIPKGAGSGGDGRTMGKENNLSSVMEYDFDFQRYIEARLREVDDLDERGYAKKVILEGLGAVIRHTEKKYKELEQRVYKEIEIPDNQYEICSTIAKRCHYDPTNQTLFPVLEEDLDIQELRRRMSGEDEICINTVYLKSDNHICRTLEAVGTIAGSILAGGEPRSVQFHLRPARRYRDVMERLYQLFQDNRISWNTVNTGYLDKFYDVYLDRNTCEELGISMEDHEAGCDLMPDVKPGTDIDPTCFLWDYIPLWNIRRIHFSSTDFMVPCIDGIYYEHEFSLDDLSEEDGYLIQFCDDILEIRHEQGKIIIKSRLETFENWTAVQIVQAETVRSLDYDAPLLTNRKRDTFFRRYSERTKVPLMTKSDLFRRIMELDIRDYIEITGYEIQEPARSYPAEQSMNWFVRDELFPIESRKILLLKFREKNPENYLNDTMVRFVISQMQMEISEFRCVGVIV